MSYGFQMSYTLSPQSPLIHFQYDVDGATLRATEVKPKFDKFLISRAKKLGLEWVKWSNKKHPNSLDYKMNIRFFDGKNADPIKLGRYTPYEIYYGNMSKDNNKRSKEVKAIRKSSELCITCFNSELRDFIDSNIDAFFITHNFGRMSSKGFGSFLVTEKDGIPRQTYDTKTIANILKEEYGAGICCSFDGGDNATVFKRIKIVYSLMKSGINIPPNYQRSLLFLYSHEKLKLDNEKAYIKEKKLAPAISRNNRSYHKRSYGEGSERYVRAVLGVGDHIDFLNDLNVRKLPNGKENKTKISISGKTSGIERLASPILFKIIGKTVYYVARRINNDIYNAEFVFSNEKCETCHSDCLSAPRSRIISVPSKEELKPKDSEFEFIDDFLVYSMKKMNGPSQYNGKRVLDLFDDTKGIIIKEV